MCSSSAGVSTMRPETSHGDLFDTATWADARRYALALLMIGRLLEVPGPKAQQVLAALRTRCDNVVLYVYPGYSDQPFGKLARQLGVQVDEKVPAVAALLSPTTPTASASGRHSTGSL
jgi:hypothetical protein